MDIDLDRYYTPVGLAQSILKEEFKDHYSVCVDSTCGQGNLLRAASGLYEGTLCVGMDRDKFAIKQLRLKHPEWLLSVGEVLNHKSLRNTRVLHNISSCDLLLLNPPFSQGNRKSVPISYKGHSFKSSVAMAHILRSLELFHPDNGAMVIMPESVLYSDIDSDARYYLRQSYQLKIIDELKEKTFSGARVRATAVKLTPGAPMQTRCLVEPIFFPTLAGGLVRGSLPVHELVVTDSKSALPFIHTTGIADLVNGNISSSIRTYQNRKGRVNGHVVLFNRVGKPRLENIRNVVLEREILLSDCVIALCFSNMSNAAEAAKRVRENYYSLLDIYRGTGARYTTVVRLADWLKSVGIVVEILG